MSKKLIVVLTIFFSVYGCAQENKIVKNNKIELIKAAKEIIQSAKTCALVTIDTEGRPRIRTMDPFPPEDSLVVWFGTNSNSRKVKQIQENSKVTLYYADDDDTGYVMIHGIAEIVSDNTEKQKHWKPKWKDFYPNFPDDYLLIKVSPEWMEIVSETRNILGDSKTWEPQKVIFKEH